MKNQQRAENQQRFSAFDAWLGCIALIALVCAIISLIYQRPISIPLNIGLEEGINNDLPFLRNFNDSERNEQRERYRWSQPASAIVLQNLPKRNQILQLRQTAGNPTSLHFSNITIEGLNAGRQLFVFIPAQASANLEVQLTTPQFATANDDPRRLGANLSQGQFMSFGFSAPPLLPLLAWLVMLSSIALLLRVLGGTPREALGLIALTGIGAIAATWFAPLRVGYGATTILLTSVYALGFAGLLRLILPYFLQRFQIKTSAFTLRWLIIITVMVFAINLWGRMLPFSMPGDMGFHRNRISFAMHGDFFIPSNHRGIPFPYPSALYSFLLPFTPFVALDPLIEMFMILCATLSIPFVFVGVQSLNKNQRAGLWGALLYGFFAANFMTLAWMFAAHIFAQFVSLIWFVLLIHWRNHWYERRIWLMLTVGLTMVGLSHFGFYINSTLFVGLLFLWFALKRQRQPAMALVMMIIVMQGVVWAVYYSAYIPMFLKQSQNFTQGGITAINERDIINRADLIRDTFKLGLWWHYAFIPIILAPLGLWLLRKVDQMGLRIIASTFIISIALAIFPIINGTTITTRWLMFSAWAIAVTSGIALDWLAQRQRWSKYLAIGATILIIVWGLTVWFGAVIFRIRPPEPF